MTPKLYIKTSCPWCIAATEFLNKHNIAFETKNVTLNPALLEEMQNLSGQTKAPTMDWDGEILADFGVEELEPFLKQKGVL